jgi:hypothetical protein
MSFLSYLYLLRANLNKFFNSKNNSEEDYKKCKYATELYSKSKSDLEHKCNKAALEIKYISSFTHWPIAKTKTISKRNSLVYLDINRSKSGPCEQRMKRKNYTNNIVLKPISTNKESTVNKIPHS